MVNELSNFHSKFNKSEKKVFIHCLNHNFFDEHLKKNDE